jgi:NADH-quinone oxidoreductase subunit C
MTDPAGIASRLTALLGVEATTAYGVVTADVPAGHWVAAVTAARDDDELDGSYFDLLTAVDQHPGGFDIVLRLWSVPARHGFHLRTQCPRDDPRVPSLVEVFAGAAWHERQAAEMFGVVFDGHPDPAPLLLPAGGVPHPLRKEHQLVARQMPWPGTVDPAYSGEGGRPPRRPLRPPGAPP